MKITVKNIGKVTMFLLLFIGNKAFAQTKTEVETIELRTNNPAITVKVIRDRNILETKAYNNSSKPYAVSFSIKATLKSKTKTFTKSIQGHSTNEMYPLKPGESTLSKSEQLPFADDEVRYVDGTQIKAPQDKSLYNSLLSAELVSFAATEIGNKTTTNNQNATTSESSSTTTNRQNTGYTPSSSVQGVSEAEATAQVVTAGLSLVNDIFSGISERKEEKRLAEAERKQREAEAYAKEAEKRAKRAVLEAKWNKRKNEIISAYPAKEIPIGKNENAQSIYYFFYAFSADVNLAWITNVFEIGKSDDGSFPYTTVIKNEIASIITYKYPYEGVLHGYYLTQKEAEAMRKKVYEMMYDTYSAKEVYYKGIPATTQNNNGSKYGKTIKFE